MPVSACHALPAKLVVPLAKHQSEQHTSREAHIQHSSLAEMPNRGHQLYTKADPINGLVETCHDFHDSKRRTALRVVWCSAVPNSSRRCGKCLHGDSHTAGNSIHSDPGQESALLGLGSKSKASVVAIEGQFELLSRLSWSRWHRPAVPPECQWNSWQ